MESVKHLRDYLAHHHCYIPLVKHEAIGQFRANRFGGWNGPGGRRRIGPF
jgi:hypothetical protein